jgi:hypothetical protein
MYGFSCVYINMSSCSDRDDAGRLVRTEMLRTKDITQRIKMKSYWQVHFNFCEVYDDTSALVDIMVNLKL